jgi:hypothetical protein
MELAPRRRRQPRSLKTAAPAALTGYLQSASASQPGLWMLWIMLTYLLVDDSVPVICSARHYRYSTEDGVQLAPR